MKWHELKKNVGEKWKHATVCIQSRAGSILPATRVSLQENDDGGLLVVLHETELDNGGFPPTCEKE